MRKHRWICGSVAGLIVLTGCGGGEGVTVLSTTGTLVITTSTSGAEPDADGYSVRIDTEPPRAIAPVATLTTSDLTPGNHMAELEEVAANCTVSGDDPRTVSVTAGGTATVRFIVTCGSTTGGGKWSTPCGWPSQGVTAIHAHLLPTGKVLFWGVDSRGGENFTDERDFIWDPAACSAQEIPHPPTHIFCSGHAFLPDGRLLVTSGWTEGARGPNGPRGPKEAYLFDHQTTLWQAVPSMADGRYYPTNTALPNGEMLVTAGNDLAGVTNTIPEVWRVGGGWRRLTGGGRAQKLYPWMFVNRDGKVVDAGPAQITYALTTTGTGKWSKVATSSQERMQGTAVMFSPGRILKVGGGDPPTNTAELLDMTALIKQWERVLPMANARRHPNATILADGTVLVTGGTTSSGWNNPAGAVLAPELWNPSTRTWTTLASMRQRRMYHSTAILLPDGRVLSAGGDPDQIDAEIFTPPYLLNSSGGDAFRPVISSAPVSITYGQRFTVRTPQAASIGQVTFIGLSSVTHGINMGQRINVLRYTEATGSLSVTAPANSRLAPPGYYLLFILKEGVPSPAKVVRIS